MQLTQVYSEVEANSYRIIPDLINTIDQMVAIHKHPSVSASRKASCTPAVNKITKYLSKFLKNRWVAAAFAFAFDPTVRQDALSAM
jgi:hypothetical protein